MGERFEAAGVAGRGRLQPQERAARHAEQAGWDWFALQLSDGRDLMFYRLRNKDGSASDFSGGTLIAPDGTTQRLAVKDIIIEALDHWRSPRTGTRYPSRWRLQLPSQSLSLDIAPVINDQELDLSVRYWEGAVSIKGAAGGKPLGGTGYVELAGY
ncbi:MAG: secreted hydrolase-like protein [Gammaproteobacteria bacterium]|nr:MAG: secreted hydrolase-like protein [Gammaproteobacteria bacterium]